MEANVTGAAELAALSRRLKEAGEKGLAKELTQGITRAMGPLRKTELPQSALSTLPRRGGLAKIVSKSQFRVSRRNSARSPGLRLTAKNIYDLYRMDKGTVRHPVFSRKYRTIGGVKVKYRRQQRVLNKWVSQPVTPGWFTNPTQKAAPQIRQNVNTAMVNVVRQIEGETRGNA